MIKKWILQHGFSWGMGRRLVHLPETMGYYGYLFFCVWGQSRLLRQYTCTDVSSFVRQAFCSSNIIWSRTRPSLGPKVDVSSAKTKLTYAGNSIYYEDLLNLIFYWNTNCFTTFVSTHFFISRLYETIRASNVKQFLFHKKSNLIH